MDLHPAANLPIAESAFDSEHHALKEFANLANRESKTIGPHVRSKYCSEWQQAEGNQGGALRGTRAVVASADVLDE